MYAGKEKCIACYASSPASTASLKGVKSSANLCSFMETAKANDLEPYAYLRHVLTELPKVDRVDTIEAMLPGSIGKDQIRAS